MNFSKILSRAAEITWRWKALWVFGFLISLGQGNRGSNYSNWVEDRGSGGIMLDHIPPAVGGLLISLVCIGLLIGIALWVLSIIGRGALIGGVQQVEEEGDTELGRAWRVGVSHFWTLFGISILTALPVLVLALFTVAAFLGPILTEIGISAGRDVPTGIFSLSFLCGAPLCCSAILAAILLSQIKIYANRAAVLEGLGWIEALQRGWQVLKDNLVPTVVLWLIFFVIGLILTLVIVAIILVIASPFLVLFANADPSLWMLGNIILEAIVIMIVSAAIGSIVETFTSTTWTLAYREMTGLGSLSSVDIEPAP